MKKVVKEMFQVAVGFWLIIGFITALVVLGGYIMAILNVGSWFPISMVIFILLMYVTYKDAKESSNEG